MVFTCECGHYVLDWINPRVKRLCNMCNTEIRQRDFSRQISLEAYIKSKEYISENQEKVLNVIRLLKSCNNRMIADSLDWSINRVTPRVKELRDEDLVVLDCVLKDEKTNIQTQFWKIKEE